MELTTGMIVETRDGQMYRVLLKVHGDTNMLAPLTDSNSLGIHIKYYNVTLNHNTNYNKDIMKVWGVAGNWADVGREKGVIKWTRPDDVKELTVEEIEAKLGYKVKVVGG